MILENKVVVKEDIKEELVKSLCSCNGRVVWEIILGDDFDKLFLPNNSITHNREYYVLEKVHNISGTAVDIFLNAACSNNCRLSILSEIKLAKKLNQDIYIASVVNENCSSLITRRKLGDGTNCDIPFSLHAIYGEYLKNGLTNIKNKEFIEPYLIKIKEGTFRTADIKNIWFMHLKLDGESYYNLFDNDYIESIQPFNEEIIDKLNDQLYIENLKNSKSFEESMLIGFEKQFSKHLINSVYYKYDRDYKLEIRLSNPVTKPSRLYILSDFGLTNLGTKVFGSKKRKSILRTRTLVKPTELRIKQKDDNIKSLAKSLSYTRVLEEGRKFGLADEDTLSRLAIIKNHKLIKVKIDENYNMEEE